MKPQRLKESVALVSVLSNSFLIGIKLVVGVLIGSISIISEAIHSTVDLAAAVIALFSVRKSGVPADRGHPFGHGKIENLSGSIEAVLIFVAAGYIIYTAVGELLHPDPIEQVMWGVAIMLISALMNTAVSELLFRVGVKTDSVALQADAWHLRTDVYTSVGVLISLVLITLGQRFAPGYDWNWLDPAAAILVALMILKAAWDLTKTSARDLLDANLPEEEEAWIQDLILAQRPAVHGFHMLRTRKAGNARFVEFHLKVNPIMTVDCSHRITVELAKSIQERFPDSSVTIHIEPCDGNCVGKCLEGCLVPESERKSVRSEQ
nr:cation transporter [Deltaproteobacteria bacterium]